VQWKKQSDEIDEVPAFWPDVDSIRHDMLDYALEVEYFDLHHDRILKMLEEEYLLKSTGVIVTSRLLME
jgi:arylsulfatase A-like enzyme